MSNDSFDFSGVTPELSRGGSPLVSREVSEALVQKGIRMLDEPVSVGKAKATDGSLAIVLGRTRVDFNKVLPIFKSTESSAVLIGGSGAGSVTMLANQIIGQLKIAAVSEALVMDNKADEDLELIYIAIRGGLARSTVPEVQFTSLVS